MHAFAAWLLLTPALAEDPNPGRAVKFETGDGVTLAGRYWPGKGGANSPTVLILDEPGAAARPEGCAAVARSLAEKGCTVLCFDYRGQGGSTDVKPAFWDDLTNRRLVAGWTLRNPPETIDHKSFRPGYLPRLLDDISAARLFLCGRHDARECCAGQTLLIGFGEGATLGQLWLGLEWSRQRLISVPFQPLQLDPKPEGRDIVGCIWIEPQLLLGKQRVPFRESFAKVQRHQRTLVGVLHGGEDTLTGRLARDLVERHAGTGKPAVVAGELPEGTEAIVEKIGAYVASLRLVLDDPLWERRDFAEQVSAWSFPTGLVPARDSGQAAFQAAPVALYFGQLR